jgi:hypothetical protein
VRDRRSASRVPRRSTGLDYSSLFRLVVWTDASSAPGSRRVPVQLEGELVELRPVADDDPPRNHRIENRTARPDAPSGALPGARRRFRSGALGAVKPSSSLRKRGSKGGGGEIDPPNRTAAGASEQQKGPDLRGLSSGETQTRTGDTTIVRESTSRDGLRKRPANKNVQGSGASASCRRCGLVARAFGTLRGCRSPIEPWRRATGRAPSDSRYLASAPRGTTRHLGRNTDLDAGLVRRSGPRP